MKQRNWLSSILTIVMLISMLTCFVLPAAGATSGTTGDCTWTLDGTVLTISGTGAMGWCYSKPWGSSITEVIIEEGVTSIGAYAFDGCSNLTSVTIGESVEYIDEAAFRKCSIESISIPDSVIFIDWGVFIGCDKLNAVRLGKNIKSIGNMAFYGCSQLSSINLPSSLSSIGYSAFYDCRRLTSITIPSNITSIEQETFYNCTNLILITIPDTVTSVVKSAFYNTGIYNDKSNWKDGILYIDNHLIQAQSTITSCIVKEGTISISAGAFQGSNYLTELIIPDSVKTIGYSAFADCKSLESIDLPERLLRVESGTFYGCNSLTSVIIPDSVNTIMSSAFYGCTNLELLQLGKNVTSIGYNAFGNCKKLTSVIIPNRVTAIGEKAFDGCSNLMEATMQSLNTWMADDAFPSTTKIIYDITVDEIKPHLTIDSLDANLAVLSTLDFSVNRIYWGYAGTEKIYTNKWDAFTAAVPSAIRVSDYNPTEGEVYAMAEQGYYLFWIQYTDANGATQNICRTVYAAGVLDENYGKPYLEFDETGKVARMNLNGTTVQKMYWGFIGDTDYKYSTWDEFCGRVRGNGSYLPDYGVKDGEGYVVNEEGYYRFVIVYLDAQGIRQERYFTVKAETPATAPVISVDNDDISSVALFVNDEGYVSKVYYGYIGDTDTGYVDFNTFKATATDFTTDFGTPAGKTFKLNKAGYWRFVINYNVIGATKDAICTVYVDEADLSLGTPKLTQSGNAVILDHNGSTVSKVYAGYMGTDPVEVDSWADYIDNRQSNATYYGPKDGTAFTLGNKSGYYTVVVSYNNGGTDQLAFYTFKI